MRGSSNNNNSSTNNNNNNSNLNDNNNMDTSFYDDNEQFTVGNNKRPATLDLHSKSLSGKKLRLNQSVAPLVIDSPADLQSVKLTTPDIERFVLNSLPTPGLQFPTKFAANTQGTSEQEDYVKGFVDALNSLHKKDSQCKMTAVASSAVTSVVSGNGMSGGSIIYTNLDDSSFPVAIKDEPQTVPNSPPLSPIDMETQERIKLERKRQRNRVAASKCRKRKLERISKLEDKVKQLKGENGELNVIVKQLRESIFSLKRQVLEHANAGCTIPLAEGK